MQTDSISFGKCVCAPSKLCTGQRRWQRGRHSLSDSLSLCFSRCCSLTEHSLFGSLTLPLRLSHHWGTGVNLSKHLKVYSSRLLHTHTHTNKNLNTHRQLTHSTSDVKSHTIIIMRSTVCLHQKVTVWWGWNLIGGEWWFCIFSLLSINCVHLMLVPTTFKACHNFL